MQACDFLKRCSVAALALLVAAVMLWGPAGRAGGRGPAGFAERAERLSPSVVNISTVSFIKPDQEPDDQDAPDTDPDADPQDPDCTPAQRCLRKSVSLGSGFLIDASGYIVTNHHVVDGASEIMVALPGQLETPIKAQLIGSDARTDLALLKIETPKPLPFVSWGDSDRARVGDWVMTIGNPYGLGGTVTTGVVSAKTRTIDDNPFDDFIQTDAAINKGSSGGPMFDMAGAVIGVNTAIFSNSGGSVGIGFAVSSGLARPIIEQLRQYGKVRRGGLGVRLQTVTAAVAEHLELGRARGALVAKVENDGPAARGRVQPGDVLLRFDGHDIENVRHLLRLMMETPLDKPVEILVWRQRRALTLPVTVTEQSNGSDGQDSDDGKAQATPAPPAPEAARPVTAFGLTLETITPALREAWNLPEEPQGETHGLVVTAVAAGSAGADHGIEAGNILIEIDQNILRQPRDVTGQLAELARQNRHTALILIDRKGVFSYFALPLDRAEIPQNQNDQPAK